MNNRMGCHAILQEIFLTQGLNLCLLHLLHWYEGSLPLFHWEAYSCPKDMYGSWDIVLGLSSLTLLAANLLLSLS